MQSHSHNFPFDPNYDLGIETVFVVRNDNYGPSTPPVSGNFLFLNGNPFLLLNGDNLVLL